MYLLRYTPAILLTQVWEEGGESTLEREIWSNVHKGHLDPPPTTLNQFPVQSISYPIPSTNQPWTNLSASLPTLLEHLNGSGMHAEPVAISANCFIAYNCYTTIAPLQNVLRIHITVSVAISGP